MLWSCGGSGDAPTDPDTTTTVGNDRTPPVIAAFSITPAIGVQPGDSITVSLSATDNTGLAATVVRWSGAASGTDSVAANSARSVTRSVKIRIPSSAALDATVTVSAEAIDLANARAMGSLPPITLTDHTPPTIAVTLGGGDPLGFVVGDTLRVHLSATDNVALAWVGYSLGAPARASDSVTVSGTAATSTLSRVIDSSWVGTSSLNAVFARDAGGNRITGTAPLVNVSNFTRRATMSAALAAPVRDVAVDTKRNVVHLSEPAVSRVEIVSLADFTTQTPIMMPASPSGLDLTLGGDSLLVAMPLAQQIGVVDLTQTTRTVQTIPLPLASGLGPDNLRVLSDNKALFSVTFSGKGYEGQVYQYDLLTKTTTRRSDAGTSGGLVTEAVPLARSGDRSAALLLIDDSCCPENGQVYTAGTSSFSTTHGVISAYWPSTSSDRTGAHFLVNGVLLGSDLSIIRTLAPPEYIFFGASALSPDGTIAYLAANGGYVAVRTSDGSVIERIRIGVTPARLVVTPDGKMLLAFTSTRIVGVKLP